MKIDNLIITDDIIKIIDTLKEQLAYNNIELFAKYFDSGTDVMVCCPYHKQGKERRPSAGIRKSDGLFHCLACGETHSLPEVVAYCLGYKDALQGYKWLAQNFASAEEQTRDGIKFEFSRGKQQVINSDTPRIKEDELDKYRYTHNYLYERGLTDEIINEFDLGYDKATDSITFPVRDINGDCMFIARRSVKTKYFDLPKGITKPLYGMYELSRISYQGTRGHRLPDVYVCEGLFDCLRLWCNGKLAVAGFGCLFNNYQIKQLQDLPCRTIVLALDNDDAGRKGAKMLRECITNKIIKEVILPEGRKDIGECTDEEIQNLKEVL